MHVSLTPENQNIIHSKINSAVQLLDMNDALYSKELMAALHTGLDNIKNGSTVPYDMAKIQKKYTLE